MESEVAFINLSATIFVPLDAKTCADFSTEATTTFTFARLRMSIKITTSISSDPLAIGIRTYKIVKMEHIDMSCEINYSQENIINPRTQVQSPIKSDKQQCVIVPKNKYQEQIPCMPPSVHNIRNKPCTKSKTSLTLTRVTC